MRGCGFPNLLPPSRAEHHDPWLQVVVALCIERHDKDGRRGRVGNIARLVLLDVYYVNDEHIPNVPTETFAKCHRSEAGQHTYRSTANMKKQHGRGWRLSFFGVGDRRLLRFPVRHAYGRCNPRVQYFWIIHPNSKKSAISVSSDRNARSRKTEFQLSRS